ncbi:hypothetical protein EMIT0P100_80236 [Pseudomonas sp. IT-P100]|nr:hypothetical protein [Pseudomonas sp.]
MIAHDRLARGLGLQRTIIIGGHKGLDEKKASLPKFSPGFNVDSIMAFCLSLWRCDLNQKKLNQSLNGLKNPHYFHIRMLLLNAVTG